MSAMVRILFTSVGRRVELLQAFREASLCTHTPLKIYGADMDETAPALNWCDEIRMICRISDDAYIPNLLDICGKEGIDLLIPTIDTDLLKLAEARESFESIGTRVLISNRDKVALCRDKRLTGAFFESCGLKAPKTYDDWSAYPGPYPCFIKPKDGSSSIDAYRVNTREQLQTYAGRIADYIVQPFVGGREYTIDIFCDYEGNLVSAVPRERVAVRSGEVLKTRVCMDDKMLREAKAVANSFRPRGPMTVQLIRDENGEDWFIEINPRYGGGAPLSMKAGARSAEYSLGIAADKECVHFEQSQVAHNAVYSRFDQSVRVDTPADLSGIRGIVFDLDDTLYLERDYVCSGFRAIANYLEEEKATEELWDYFSLGQPAIDKYVEKHDCAARKQELLNVYRNHRPAITLSEDVRANLSKLKERGLKLGIITDGRPEGQRAKLDALDLWDMVDDVVITDELGGLQFRKPCDIAFRLIQRKWGIPFEELAYVGDNVTKDFQAPRQLGMRCVLLETGKGLYAPNRIADSTIIRVGHINDIVNLIESPIKR